MPIPGDNGNPREERQKQNARIRDVALTGADVQKDINHWNTPEKNPEIHLDGSMNIKILCNQVMSLEVWVRRDQSGKAVQVVPVRKKKPKSLCKSRIVMMDIDR
jgi:hypothetical protein